MDEDYSASSSGGGQGKKVGKQHNTLPFWGNEASMNLNPLILANIQSSSYFKVHLFKLKTYHEVVDEIYYQVKHMEPWERGSRKTSGQTGMCGGVRGVGAGGIVSTAYCLLYKLYTLRLTRKQVNGLLNHTDSPYIRALGFMYLRYTQPPGDLYEWYEDYLQDEEEIDVKAGGGQVMTVGQMVYQFMTKLDWFSTLFPRIPVPIQKQTERKMEQYCRDNGVTINQLSSGRGGNVVAPATNEIAHATNMNDEEEYGGSRSGDGIERRDHRDRGGSERRDHRDRGGSGGGGFPLPSVSNYRTEHDERDYYNYKSASSSGRRRGEDFSPPPPSTALDNKEKERHRSKHKKKHKHKHSSRSRSRSHSHSRSRHERRERREREHRDREHYDRDRGYEHRR